MSNPLRELNRLGQSVWYDNIRRGLITSGEFQRLVEDDGISGVTANPTIFEKAISGSTDYDAALYDLLRQEASEQEIYEALAVEDIRMAADILRPIYDGTSGADGYVSIEVSPKLAYDTEGTIAEAQRFRAAIDRPNVMIKVPATKEGLPAIERLTAEGVNVNVTLTFALERYEEVAWAYIRGLEQRAEQGRPLDAVASVASFFVSRVDTLVDKLLEARLRETSDPQEQERLRSLLGKAAIANAKLAYQKFQEIFGSGRFQALKANGARVQRPLWASTSTKNPNYPDTYYADALIGPDTVDTMAPATIPAFRDHGKVALTLEADVEGAHETMRRLAEVGIDMAAVTQQLEDEGVQSFADSFNKLLDCIRSKREALQAGRPDRQSAALHGYEASVQAALAALDEQQFGRRLWEKDGALWSADPERQRAIKERLGWLSVVEAMQEHLGQLDDFAAEMREAGFTHAVLLGMGGSSLAPEVCRYAFGAASGWPDLTVLDTTDPRAVLDLEQRIDLAKTLFIVSSKSGTTIETLSFYRYFFEKVRASKDGRAGEQFVAITDPGTPLEGLAREAGFRRVFLNQADIGGRYSALSYFGLVPAAVMGVDVRRLLDRAEEMVQACASCVPAPESPGLWLGAVLGELAKAGRDKATFVLSPRIERFGAWAEQLLAESTGKEGKGVVPVDGEPLGEPEVYRDDRAFIYLQLDGDANDALDARLAALEAAGHPVVRLRLADVYDLGPEFFRWEVATVVLGALLGIDPFDEPNVEESKVNTRRLLEEYQTTGRLPEEAPVLEEDGVALYAEDRGAEASLEAYLSAFLRQAQPGDYLALMAFLAPSDATHAALQLMRTRLRDRLGLAATVGFGPRFLHSTGQLHKGGAPNGLFLQVTGDDPGDVAIPGMPYTFGVLKRAQALGDLQALQKRGLRVLRLHLHGNAEVGLERLAQVLERAQAA